MKHLIQIISIVFLSWFCVGCCDCSKPEKRKFEHAKYTGHLAGLTQNGMVNPYPSGSVEASEWAKGWLEGWAERTLPKAVVKKR